MANMSLKELHNILDSNPDVKLAIEEWGGMVPQKDTPHTLIQQAYNNNVTHYLELAFETYWLQLEREGRSLTNLRPVVWQRNYKFDVLYSSRMELDFAIPELKVGVEINGGQGQAKSGHSNWKGLERDAVKQNLAILQGWKLFWLTTSMLRRSEWSKHVGPIFEYVSTRWRFVPDWDAIPPMFTHAAVDEDGSQGVFQAKPVIRRGYEIGKPFEGYWYYSYEDKDQPLNTFQIGPIDLKGFDWTQTLMERPPSIDTLKEGQASTKKEEEFILF